MELLESTGFVRRTEIVPGAWKDESHTEQVLVFDRGISMTRVKMALTLIEPVLQKAIAEVAAEARHATSTTPAPTATLTIDAAADAIGDDCNSAGGQPAAMP